MLGKNQDRGLPSSWQNVALFLNRRMSQLVVMVLACVFSLQAAPLQDSPLEMPDTSSPRTTIESFMRYTSDSLTSFDAGQHPSYLIKSFQRAEYYLDLSQVSPDLKQTTAIEASLLLYEVINRIGLSDVESIPDKQQTLRDEIEQWKLPKTNILIHRVANGERSGEFLFSPSTIENIYHYYEAVKHLPIRTHYHAGNYEQFVNRPDIYFPYQWVNSLPDWALYQVLRNPVWKWVASVIILVAAIVAIKMFVKREHFFSHKLPARIQNQFILSLLLAVLPTVVSLILSDVIALRFGAMAFSSKCLWVISFASSIWAVYLFMQLIAEYFIVSQRILHQSIDAHLIKAVARLSGVVVSLTLIMFAAKYLGFDLTPVLAGMGLGGLAIALAARPTLENIIAGFTLFADKPVRIGDFCKFGQQQGTVEEIGLRSTRIRRLDDKLVTIPNADFCQMEIENYSLIRHRLLRTSLAIRYDVTDEQLRLLLVSLRKFMIGHPLVLEEKLNVRLCKLGDYSVDIEVYAKINTNEWLTYRAIREDILLKLFELVNQSGTEFAFPSQTIFVEKGYRPDLQKRQQAHHDVQQWRDNKAYPFPEFSAEETKAMFNKQTYPSKRRPED
ncbi:mechanosensitive ion channel [Photobacterium swingsii]